MEANPKSNTKLITSTSGIDAASTGNSDQVTAEKCSLDITCRTCCVINRDGTFTQLFQTEFTANYASQEIKDELDSFHLTITKDDGLPQQICSNCSSTFLMISRFRKHCQTAQRNLVAYFAQEQNCSEDEIHPESLVESEISTENIESSLSLPNTSEIYSPNSSNYNRTSSPSCISENIKTEITAEDESFSMCNMGSKPLCANCNKTFSSYEELSMHFEVCSAQSHPTSEDYNIPNMPPDKFTICSICQCEFENELDLINHIQHHTNVNFIQCNRCGRSFNGPRALKKHFLRMHEQSEHECEICHMKFNNEYRFKYHLRSHDPSKLFQCTICEKSFMAVHHLRAHTMMHQDIRPFPCELCDKKYRDKRSLETHQRKHNGERPYVCNICNKDFAIRTSYVMHVRKHDHAMKDMQDRGVDIKLQGNDLSKLQAFPFKCTICSQGFKVAYSLAAHLKTHFEERIYDCKECGKTFKNTANLKSHMKLVHLKVKNFSCDFCKKQFTFSDELKSHKKVHTDEKPFKCETCGKCFKRKNGYIAHERIHTGDIYTCEVCGKSCKSHSRLADHIMTHTSQERYEVQRRIEEAAFKSAM